MYDGDIWKHFRTNFLSVPYSYLLCLNVDWFQPFKHTQYSIGAIYVTIQNLPRRERYKPENVLLIGIIPGPKEPALSIDSFLQPLINELNEYYPEGFIALTHRSTWKKRTAAQHREECWKINLAMTKTSLRAAESQYGVRFCALLRLSYYDPIKFIAVDLMHNLFLGTSKHMFCTWIDLGLLSDDHLNKLDLLIKEFVVPNNTGRLPIHIKSNY